MGSRVPYFQQCRAYPDILVNQGPCIRQLCQVTVSRRLSSESSCGIRDLGFREPLGRGLPGFFDFSSTGPEKGFLGEIAFLRVLWMPEVLEGYCKPCLFGSFAFNAVGVSYFVDV